MPGSQEWRNRAASQITQQLPDNTADALAVLDPARLTDTYGLKPNTSAPSN